MEVHHHRQVRRTEAVAGTNTFRYRQSSEPSVPPFAKSSWMHGVAKEVASRTPAHWGDGGGRAPPQGPVRAERRRGRHATPSRRPPRCRRRRRSSSSPRAPVTGPRQARGEPRRSRSGRSIHRSAAAALEPSLFAGTPDPATKPAASQRSAWLVALRRRSRMASIRANEIRYRVISRLLSRRPCSSRISPCYGSHARSRRPNHREHRLDRVISFACTRAFSRFASS